MTRAMCKRVEESKHAATAAACHAHASRQETASATSAMASRASTMALRIEGHLAKIEDKVESRAAVTPTKQTHPALAAGARRPLDDRLKDQPAAPAADPAEDAFHRRHQAAGPGDPTGFLWYSHDLIEIPITTILLATDRVDR